MKLIKVICLLFLLSGCVRYKEVAEEIVNERISTIPPESFFNINIKPRGDIYLVSFPAENSIGYHQFAVRGYEYGKPDKLKFYHPIAKIQNEVDHVCKFNNISQVTLLPLMHDKITSYLKIGVGEVRGINSKPYVAFQYPEEIVLYYVANLSKDELNSLVTSSELQLLNKSWLYKKHEKGENLLY